MAYCANPCLFLSLAVFSVVMVVVAVVGFTRDKESVYSPDWPGTQYLDQASLELSMFTFDACRFVLQNTWQWSHVSVVVESGNSTSLPPGGYSTKTGRPAHRMSGNWRLWEMNIFTLWAARMRPPLRLKFSPPESTLWTPLPGSFSLACQPLLIRLERLLVLMAFGALGTSPWSIRELKHKP